jgi:hypothetical protein
LDLFFFVMLRSLAILPKKRIFNKTTVYFLGGPSPSFFIFNLLAHIVTSAGKRAKITHPGLVPYVQPTTALISNPSWYPLNKSRFSPKPLNPEVVTR